MSKAKIKLTKRIIALIVCGAFILALALTAFCLQIWFWAEQSIKCWHPDYAKADLSEVLEKQSLSKEDYELLYRQTGLTKIGVDRALEYGSVGKQKILNIQHDFFEPHEVENGQVAPYTCTDYIDKHIEYVYLQDGDIVITSSTHISGVRIGHAGLVTDGAIGQVLQANAYGSNSRLSGISSYTDRVNFIILRPNPDFIDGATVQQVVEYAKKNLVGIPYEGLSGLLTDKNAIASTQCAHIVWYAYKQFGIDLDSNGGQMVMPKDIANSGYLQVVQVFGLDPDKLWR